MYVKEFDIYLPVRGKDVCDWCTYRCEGEVDDQADDICEYSKFHSRLIPRPFTLTECVGTAGRNSKVFKPDRDKIEELLTSRQHLKEEQHKYV
jgi:hypothetical protein